MSNKELFDLFLEKRYQLDMGAGKLSKMYKTTIEEIKKIKKAVKDEIKTLNLKNEDIYKVSYNKENKLPKILLLDIETAPLLSYVWGLWKQDITIDRISSDWFCLSWSAKWLYEPTVHGDVLTSNEALLEDDFRIMKNLWNLLEEADIVITHHGDKFDIPRINTRFIIHGFPPNKPFHSIDTKKVASRKFSFSSNKLDFLAKTFGIDCKLDTKFSLWKGCLDGDQESLNYMLAYNMKDVEILEEVYLKLRSWIPGHPNAGLYVESDKDICPNCGSENLTEAGTYTTQISSFELNRCECGALIRKRKSIKKVNTVSVNR